MKNVKDITKDIFKKCPSCGLLMQSHVSRTPSAVDYYVCSTKQHAFYNDSGKIGAPIQIFKNVFNDDYKI